MESNKEREVYANSRFTVFIPVVLKLSVEELSARVKMEWPWVLAESLRVLEYLPRSDIALLLDSLSQLNFDVPANVVYLSSYQNN